MHRTIALYVLLLLPLLALPGDAQQRPSHSLIRPPKSVPSDVRVPEGRGVVRGRLVSIDLGPLGRPAATRDRKTPVDLELDLDLFDGAQHRAQLTFVTSGVGGAEVFEGRLEHGGTVTLAVTGGEVFANFKAGSRWYQIRYVGRNLHAVLELDESAFPTPVDPIVPPAEPQQFGTALKEAVASADDGSIIDVLVMYTPRAKTAMGGLNGITNLINTAVAETNTAYQNSGVNHRLRLVHASETVDWLYNGSPINADSYYFQDAILMLREPSDGPMDEAHSLRNTYGADAVALVVDRSDVCGIGYMMSDQSYAFSVTSLDCATGYYSFGHELGHNMGLEHDRANATGGRKYSYGLGWADPNGAFRTVMAYASGCGYGSCPRIQHFSNPTVNYNGSPTGSPVGTATEAHAAQALNNISSTFANFRASKVASCTYTVSPASASYGAAGGSGTVSVTVTSGTGCSWSASTGSSFITITGGSAGSGNGTVSYTVAANGTTPRTGSLLVAGQSVSIQQSGGTPGGVNARATAANSITVTWNPFPGATYYTVQRRAPGENFVDWVGTSGTSYTDTWGVAGATSYLYRVEAYTSEGWSQPSAADIATTVMFTDDPLVAGSTNIKGEHLTQVRSAIAAARTLAGLSVLSVTDPVLTGVAAKAVHITELQAALDAALIALSLPSGGFTSVATGGAIETDPLQQLRDRVE